MAATDEPYFELGKLAEYYDVFQDQLPQVLEHERPAVEDLTFLGTEEPPVVTSVETWLFALPSDQVVAAVSLEISSPHPDIDPGPTVKALELCAYANIGIGGLNIADYVAMLAARNEKAKQIDDGPMPLPPERHQLVFARQLPSAEPDRPSRPNPDNTWRILYRVDPPFLGQFMEEVEPTGLNQEGPVFGAVTPYVSLLYGHQPYVENSVFLTTVQALGTAARFRQIWREAYRDVRRFRIERLEVEPGNQQREDLEELVDRLGNLELDLSFSVETSADLGLLIPSLRIGSFHKALYEVLELPTRARTVSRMFTRLESSIRSEITAIEIREHRAAEEIRGVEEAARRAAEENRQVRDAAATAMVSFGAVPITFLLGFFGANTSDVDDKHSLFNLAHFWWIYLIAILLGSLPILIFRVIHGRVLFSSLIEVVPQLIPAFVLKLFSRLRRT